MMQDRLQFGVDRVAPEKDGHLSRPCHPNNTERHYERCIMKQIGLSQGQVALVDDEDYCRISCRNWYAIRNEYGYYAAGTTPMVKWIRKRLLMHRIIMCAKKGQIIDHRDGDGLNNQKYNLRFCTISQNGQNQRISTHPSKLSKYKGVTWHKGGRKWQAAIRGENKKNYYLGSYANEDDAARAYDEKAKELFGEFARINNV